MFHLQGIVETPKSGSKAIINGEVYTEGSVIKGVTILKIKGNTVVYEFKGKTFVQRITQ